MAKKSRAKIYTEHGLTLAAMEIFNCLLVCPKGLKAIQISTVLGRTKSVVYQVLNKLTELGLATRVVENPGADRKTFVFYANVDSVKKYKLKSFKLTERDFGPPPVVVTEDEDEQLLDREHYFDWWAKPSIDFSVLYSFNHPLKGDTYASSNA